LIVDAALKRRSSTVAPAAEIGSGDAVIPADSRFLPLDFARGRNDKAFFRFARGRNDKAFFRFAQG